MKACRGVNVSLMALLLLPTSLAWSAEDLLVDLRGEAQKEVAQAARLATKTATIAGTGEAAHRQVPQTTIALATGEATYELQYTCAVDEQGHRAAMGQTLSELGMSGPSPANWYQGGFIDVLVDGTGLEHFAAAIESCMLPPGQAGVRFAWPHPRGTITLECRVYAFDPVLYLVVDLPEAGEREVKLLCYPNSFQLPRDRWITTPERDIHHYDSLHETLPPGERQWVLYSDRAADMVAAPRTGPSAVVLLPDQWARAEVAMGMPERPDWPAVQNYGVMTSLCPLAGQKRVAFALVDFLPMTWTQARAFLQAQSSAIQSRLRDLLATGVAP